MKKSLFVKIKTVEPVSMLFYHLVNTEAGARNLYLGFPVLTFLKWLLIKSEGGGSEDAKGRDQARSCCCMAR